MTDTTSAPLGPFKSADKAVGLALAAVALGAVGYALFVALPYLIALAANTIIFIGEMVVLAFLALVFGSPSTWGSIYYKWRNVSRKIRRAIVREDPIGTLDTVITRFRAKLDEIDAAIAQAVAAAKRQGSLIKQTLDKCANETQLAKQAKAQNQPEPTIAQHAAAAMRWQKAADDLQPQAQTFAKMQTCLERARDLCASKLADLESQKEVLAVRLEADQTAQKSVRLFKRFLGHSADSDMQDMALDEIERQSTEAEAEIDQFMRIANPLLEAQDLQKSADAAAAMDKFSTYLDGAKDQKALPGPTLAVKDGEVVERARVAR